MLKACSRCAPSHLLLLLQQPGPEQSLSLLVTGGTGLRLNMVTSRQCWTPTIVPGQSCLSGAQDCSCCARSICQTSVHRNPVLCRQLKDHIWTFAAGLRALGLQAGDKVRRGLLV